MFGFRALEFRVLGLRVWGVRFDLPKGSHVVPVWVCYGFW